ncbi:MAG: hypothetical protein QNJ30_09300 [Kiloniellales bacterium]|nr:hypothetical protein [Kiloniellales bacterium]
MEHCRGREHRRATADEGVPDRLTGTAPLVLLAAASLLALSGCGSFAPVERPPLAFSEAALPETADGFPNWPYPPARMETLLGETLVSGDFELAEIERTKYGGSGPSRVTLYFTALDRPISFKWKAVPPNDLEAVNNTPRKEIAAYEIQKLFLEPEDFVVPTTVLHCEPMARYARKKGALRPSVAGSDCVLGVLALWLDDVTMAKALYEQDRFVTEPVYAHYMANFNLMTYLIDHKDARESNFLVSKDDARRQVFSIDNGIAFQPFLYKFFAENWNVIRVPGLRGKYVERLRRLRREDLEVLGVVAEMERDERGIFVPVSLGPNLSPNEGTRLRGSTLQIGLARFEIDGVWARIQDLLESVDSGEIPVF